MRSHSPDRTNSPTFQGVERVLDGCGSACRCRRSRVRCSTRPRPRVTHPPGPPRRMPAPTRRRRSRCRPREPRSRGGRTPPGGRLRPLARHPVARLPEPLLQPSLQRVERCCVSREGGSVRGATVVAVVRRPRAEWYRASAAAARALSAATYESRTRSKVTTTPWAVWTAAAVPPTPSSAARACRNAVKACCSTSGNRVSWPARAGAVSGAPGKGKCRRKPTDGGHLRTSTDAGIIPRRAPTMPSVYSAQSYSGAIPDASPAVGARRSRGRQPSAAGPRLQVLADTANPSCGRGAVRSRDGARRAVGVPSDPVQIGGAE